jgi:hypothetical protein
MIKEVGCAMCERLWSEYEAASHSSFKLENKLNIAKSMHDSAALALLGPADDEARQTRLALRQQILKHGAEAHARADAATA